MKADFDIVVIGSGIAGSILALVTSRMGLSTLVVERGAHPKFAIGESTVPTTSLMFRSIAHEFEVPELADVAHYLGLRQHGCTAWPKQCFWHGVHTAGQTLPKHHELMLEALLLPNGPDVHMLRADVDSYLVSLLPKYGVEYVDHSEFTDFETTGGGVRLSIKGPDGERSVTARLVLDASGHASFLARRYGLRDANARAVTNTRSIFGHVQGVPALDEAIGPSELFRFVRNAGTMHHCFAGGWVWVIPFDNGVTSVGFQFDRRRYPLDASRSVEEEIAAFLEQYPSIQAHLGGMQPIRPWIRADRIQFTSSTIIGDGFLLTPHASGFIEPLFSSGILLTLSFCLRFARQANIAQQSGDWTTEQFRPIERAFFAELDQIDHIVDSCVQAGRNYDVYKQCWRTWVVATISQFTAALLTGGSPAREPILYGTGVEGYPQAVREVHRLATNWDLNPIEVATSIRSIIDPFYARICAPFTTLGDWSVGSPHACSPFGSGDPEALVAWFEALARDAYARFGSADAQRGRDWVLMSAQKLEQQRQQYRESLAAGSEFHRLYDRVLGHAVPGRLDYRARVGLDS